MSYSPAGGRPSTAEPRVDQVVICADGVEYAQAYFVHIPKTAGSSFLKVLADAELGRQRWLPRKPKLFPFLRQAGDYAVLHGHVPYPVVAVLLQPLFTMTFLRDPVSRVISYFEHVEREHEREDRPGLGTTYETWERRGLKSALEIATKAGGSNLQVAFLGVDCDFAELFARFERGEATAEDARTVFQQALMRARGEPEAMERAKQRIEHMPFFGITERFADSVRLLGEVIGRPLSMPETRENVAPESQRAARAAQYGAEAIDAIASRNPLDVELYEFASELFDRRYRAAFGEPPSSAAAG